MANGQVRVSAHASRTDTSGIKAYEQAVTTGADYVELDIRRTADGELVAFHDPRTSQGYPLSALGYARLCDLAGYEVPKVHDVFAVLKGRAKAHLDLKEANDEPETVQLALDILGPGQFIATSLEDASVAVIRSRFRDADAVPVALSLGRGLRGVRLGERLRTRGSELWPVPRLEASGAEWAAVNHRLALAGTARRCRRHGRKVMVWTVNSERELRYWLRQPIDILVTDRPALAVELRDQPCFPVQMSYRQRLGAGDIMGG